MLNSEQSSATQTDPAVSRRPRKKMLIVSSYNRPCGIAQYVEAIEPALRERAQGELEIAALPVDLMRSQSKFARTAAKEVYREIVAKAGQADVVNIQLEPGLFGLTPFEIWSRLDAIIKASKKVVITYHTVPPSKSAKFGLRPRQLLEFLRSYRGDYVFSRLFAAARKQPGKFQHIVQTKREKKNFTLAGIDPSTILDQPLSFISAQERHGATQQEAREALIERFALPDHKIIGCFGFLSPYKGIGIAIESLRHLPDDYTLLVAGGLHPEGVVHNKVKQPYVEELTKMLSPKSKKGGFDKQQEKFAKRVHFLGALDEKDFRTVLAGCDAVVLPYAEVGQTSSGPAAMALDLQRPIYCSRTFCFSELDKYQKGMLSFFEIGNHIELAQKILRQDADRPERVSARSAYIDKFNVESRADLYWKAFGALT